MTRLRHRKWFQRTVLLAMAALLWSQFTLAAHAGCLDLPGPSAAVAAAADTRHGHGHGHGHDCGTELPSTDEALCDAHCSEDDISANSGSTPSVPPLFAGAWLPWFAVAYVVNGLPAAISTWIDSPPRPTWRRPTAHPAALLLI